jgi:hypothetical protein
MPEIIEWHREKKWRQVESKIRGHPEDELHQIDEAANGRDKELLTA